MNSFAPFDITMVYTNATTAIGTDFNGVQKTMTPMQLDREPCDSEVSFIGVGPLK